VAELKVPPLVWQPEYQPDVVLDLYAMPTKKSWTIAPLANSVCGGSTQQRRPTHHFEVLHFPVLADPNVKPNHALNPLLYGIQGVGRVGVFYQPTDLQILCRLRL
jgi:hypothetical protein